MQGDTYNGAGANFDFDKEATVMQHDFEFPNVNFSWFAEHIFRITDRWNVTPGVRVEFIQTTAAGNYHDIARDNRDSITSDVVIFEHKKLPRKFLLGAIGSSYKFRNGTELYGNLSQNYRSVTFNDIRVSSPSFEVDPAIEDERGFSGDLGVRGVLAKSLRYDVNVFSLYYGNRIGEYGDKRNGAAIRRRGNVGAAMIYGLESFLELDLLSLMKRDADKWKLAVYSNFTLTEATYVKSAVKNIDGKRVEYVPVTNFKSGVQLGYRTWKFSFQFSHLSEQYTDATNIEDGGYAGVTGVVPSYSLMDMSAGWSRKWLSLEASINNLANVSYFTRRAIGYPGPGIIPGEGRSIYLTAGFTIR
ncbi:MAG: hypothetical protein EOP49_22200 [Sphingobacteriales bacterium]|nr:MAG: hypothetical protein EOP49_22200 [Sphingobacteriales bacterium]